METHQPQSGFGRTPSNNIHSLGEFRRDPCSLNQSVMEKESGLCFTGVCEHCGAKELSTEVALCYLLAVNKLLV